MIVPILFILFLNLFNVALVLSSLRTGTPAIIGMMVERSSGSTLTRTNRPFAYWAITGSYMLTMIVFAIETPSMIGRLIG